MSLRVWLPLNGDLQNKGLDDVEVIEGGATVDANGKIGKCYSFNGQSDTIAVSCNNFPIIFAGDFSITMWVYNNDSGGRSILFGDYGLTGNWFNIEKTTSEKLRFYWDDGKPNWNPSNTSMPVGVWTHVVFTKSNNDVKFYINGVLTDSLTYSMSVSVPANATLFYLGRDVRIGTTAFNGKMNDVRIYDHCLSPKEVKEISKGLVAHYPLNDRVGNPNEIVNSLPWTISGWNRAGTGWSNELVENDFSPSGYVIRTTHSGTGANNGGAHHQARDYTQLEDGEVYTLSAWIRASEELKVNFHNELMTSHSPAYPITVDTEWKKYTMTGPIDLSKQYHSNIIYSTGAGVGDGTWIEVCMLKLEKGSVATPWIPNSADASYSELGLDDNIVYDCSGYEHNGTKTSTGISCSSDSPRYSSCMDFETSGYINAGTGGKVTDEITISGWIYENPWTADPHPWSCTQDGGWNIQSSNNKPTFPVYVNTVGYVYSTSGDISTPFWTDLSPGWHLFTGTYDGFNVKLYIDGELVANKATGKTDKLPIHYYATNSIFLHREATATGSTGSYTACKLSDVRIYATALSAEDIKELYETSASIDNHGNMWAYEIQEV